MNQVIKKIKELGQFYTKSEVVELVCDIFFNKLKNFLDFNEYLFIEPSAGTGNFLNYIKEKKYKIIGFDIEPKDNSIIKLDYLNENINEYISTNNIIIGNPPFGKRSKTAIEFFNKSCLISNIIAFIVPNQFAKYSVQNKLSKNFCLIEEIILEPESFYTEKNNNYKVNCIFQIWIKNSFLEELNDKNNKNNKQTNKNIFKNIDCKELKDLRIKKKPPIIHSDFKLYQYNNTKSSLKVLDNNFDFAIFSQGYGNYSKKIYKKEELNTKKHRLLFKADNKETLDKLKNIDFTKLSKLNTTIPGFRKADIIKEYNRLYGTD